RHLRREAFFVADENLAETKKNFGAARRGCASPAIKRIARSINRRIHVFLRRKWKTANGVARVGRVDILKPFPARTRYPLAADIVVISFSCRARRNALASVLLTESFFRLRHKEVVSGQWSVVSGFQFFQLTTDH